MYIACSILFLLSALVHGMDTEKYVQEEDVVKLIPEASYFVINTSDGYTMYRSQQILIYPDRFYDEAFKHIVTTENAVVSFHDKHTNLIKLVRHPEPEKYLQRWYRFLNPLVQPAAYRALVFQHQKIVLYDRNKCAIVQLWGREWNGSLSPEQKETLSDYADITTLGCVDYIPDNSGYSNNSLQLYAGSEELQKILSGWVVIDK